MYIINIDMDWTEIIIKLPTRQLYEAEAIANMTVPYGIYIEDYSTLEQDAMEIAHIDLIDEDLLKKDRDTALIHIYISPESNPAEALSFLAERLTAASISYTLDTASCRQEDWINNWKKYFKPMPVGKKLLIRPYWEDNYEADGRTVLNLEPGVAFGSGTHETTRLCLETLENYITPGTRMLDVGCGSGILSVAALLLGAESATGVDIDSLAVKTAIENGRINNFGTDRYTVLEGNLTDKVHGRFTLVTANIVADAIIMLSKNIRDFMEDGAKYIVSGIIEPREQDVVTALEEYGFRITDRHADGGWVCLEAEINNS